MRTALGGCCFLSFCSRGTGPIPPEQQDTCPSPTGQAGGALSTAACAALPLRTTQTRLRERNGSLLLLPPHSAIPESGRRCCTGCWDGRGTNHIMVLPTELGQGPQTKAVIQCTTDDKRDCSCHLVTKTCLLGGQEYKTLGLGGWASSLQ